MMGTIREQIQQFGACGPAATPAAGFPDETRAAAHEKIRLLKIVTIAQPNFQTSSPIMRIDD
jgi:hypothetical protein